MLSLPKWISFCRIGVNKSVKFNGNGYKFMYSSILVAWHTFLCVPCFCIFHRAEQDCIHTKDLVWLLRCRNSPKKVGTASIHTTSRFVACCSRSIIWERPPRAAELFVQKNSMEKKFYYLVPDLLQTVHKTSLELKTRLKGILPKNIKCKF